MALTPWVSRAWYIDYCLGSGLAVDYWDLRLLFLGDKQRPHHLADELQNEGRPPSGYDKSLRQTQILSYAQLEQLIKDYRSDDVVYVMLLSYSWLFVRPFILLSKHSQRMIYIDVGEMPVNPTGLAKKAMQLQRALSSPFKKVLSYTTNKLPGLLRKLGVVKPYELIFTISPTTSQFLTVAKKTIGINLRDYDQYKIVQNNKRIILNKYAVFIDQNLPAHPDLELLKLKRLNSDEYYGELDKFFEKIKRLHNLDVVVATHPTNNNSWRMNQSRLMYPYVTEELIKDAEFVIAHTSTAISYAVLNHKPILFIYTEQMKVLYKDTIIQQINAIAQYLGQDTYNINKLNRLESLRIEAPKLYNYEKYKYQYLTNPESENKYSDAIYFAEVTKLFK
jgi:hypothetical protein